MFKGGITRFVITAIAIIAATGFVLLSAGIVALYLPPVQRKITEKALVAISEKSEFDITTGDISLTFPFTLSINDFSIAKEGEMVANGDRLAASIYLPALLKGEIEVNYITLENIRFDTGDIIESTIVKGEIGYLRSVVRNISPAESSAEIRQFRIQNSEIEIIAKGAKEEETTTKPFEWIFTLHKGYIENMSLSVSMPDDTLQIKAGTQQITIKDAVADIGKSEYSAQEITLAVRAAGYDSGTGTHDEAPMQHIEIESIELAANNLSFTPTTAGATIGHIAVKQKDGAEIAGNDFSIATDSTHLNISHLNLESSSGSYIRCDANIPFDILQESNERRANALLDASINKSDIATLLTNEQKKRLAALPDSMLRAKARISGTAANIKIDTAYISLPTIADIRAKGEFAHMNDNRRRSAAFTATANIASLATLLGEKNDTLQQHIKIDGKGAINGTICFADIEIEGDGHCSLEGTYDLEKKIYDARIGTSGLSLASILPSVPATAITMQAAVTGKGTDIFDKETYYQATAVVDSMMYGACPMSNISATAMQVNSKSQITLQSDNENSRISLYANSEIGKRCISSNATIEIGNIALDKMMLADKPISTGMNIEISAYTDMNETHRAVFDANDIFINTNYGNFTPAPIHADFATAPDSSHINLQNGDLELKSRLASGYTYLFAQLDKMKKMFQSARTNEKTIYYATDFERLMPGVDITFTCGEKNMLHNLMAWNGVEFESINLDCSIDTLKGLYTSGAIYNLKTGDTKLDTMRIFAKQNGESLRYLAGVRSSATNEQNKKQNYSAAIYGTLKRDSLDTNISLTGNEREKRTLLGIKTLLQPQGLDINIKPTLQIFGEKIYVNEGNYIRIGKNEAVSANVKAIDKQGAGIHLYTIDDSTALHDISLEIFNIDLKRATAMMPYAPDVSGTLYSDLHYRKDSNGMLFSGDVRSDSLTYEGTYIGNEILESVYLPRADKSHYLSLTMQHNDNEVLNMNGNYTGDNEIDGEATLTHLPLEVINAFIKGSNIGINGDIDGTLAIKGKLSAPVANGHIMFDSVRIDAPLLGSELRMHNEILNIDNSKVIFDNLNIYAKGDTPFKVNGNIDISNITNPMFNLRMRAGEYELINAPKQKNSIVYGNLVLNINSLITGPLQNLKIYGDATVLGKSNITYVVTESELAASNELDGLVEFVNFKDSTTISNINDIHDFGNISLSMNLKIEDGAWINADFGQNRSSYITLQGGGQLNMGYSSETGISLIGRYTLNNGEIKYSLPIIPLKTFNISPGSYVNWTGDIMNPTLNITALERVMAPITIDGGNTQAVAFNVGLKLTNSLDNMGLAFTMSAPENAAVQDELNSLDAETLNKYAVTMLITGAYVGNSGGLTVSSALTSFLDARINDIAGDAMKSVSINVGITDVENKETGGSYMNYSFSFAKRFWNDRITIVIGGEVNSGEQPEEEQSFINNVSLEWRITPNGNRYIRIFYDKNYESILEGEITETGVGYVYKRKLDSLNELLIFKRKDKEMPTRPKERKE